MPVPQVREDTSAALPQGGFKGSKDETLPYSPLFFGNLALGTCPSVSDYWLQKVPGFKKKPAHLVNRELVPLEFHPSK